jgi:hypothetical protein
MKANLRTPGLVLAIALAGVCNLFAQTNTDTNAMVFGPLGGLEKSATKLGVEQNLPAKLSALLWQDFAKGEKKCAVKKMTLPGKHDGDARIFCVRKDNQDIVLMQRVESKPDTRSILRREFYYRTTAQGDLLLALTATFQFGIDDVDNEILKSATWDTYGDTAIAGAKARPFTADIKAEFDEEKKFWLAQEKKLKKQERSQKK